MNLSDDDFGAVRRLPLFASVARSAVERLLRMARLHEFAAGSILFREGERPDALHIALDGYIALTARDDNRDEAIIEFVPPGQPFIVAAVILDKPFLMSAKVVEKTRVVLIPAAEFRAAVASEPSLALSLNMVAAENWRFLIGQIKSLKMRTAPQRLAAFLISLVDKRVGQATVRLPCERQVLAGWLGMVPTSASRAFRELAALGVEGRGRVLQIKSLGRLAEFAKLIP